MAFAKSAITPTAILNSLDKKAQTAIRYSYLLISIDLPGPHQVRSFLYGEETFF